MVSVGAGSEVVAVAVVPGSVADGVDWESDPVADDRSVLAVVVPGSGVGVGEDADAEPESVADA